MKTIDKIRYGNTLLPKLAIALSLLSGCTGNQDQEPAHENGNSHGSEAGQSNVTHLSQSQFDALNLKVDTIPLKNISSTVEANGVLEVPPQNEAAVTAIIGANVTSIKVIEGDPVKTGQVLATLNHPDLARLQTEYNAKWNELDYLEQEYKRQKRLYEEEVSSGKEFQKARSEYLSAKGAVKGLESQLRQLGLKAESIREGGIHESVPVKSPIDGYIKMVNVKTGQYVQPQHEMFEVVNTHHIHADLMVFEKDVHKVREGQRVRFMVQTIPGQEMEAVIYAVGKTFEQDPKAVHVHAEIENKKGRLIPGMYIRGRIIVNDLKTYALPQEAVVQEGEDEYIFKAQKGTPHSDDEWEFTAVKVITEAKDNDWVEVRVIDNIDPYGGFVWNNAYYILSEWKKGEGGGHSHHH